MRIQLDLGETYLNVLEFHAAADYRSRKEFMEVLLMKYCTEHPVPEQEMEMFLDTRMLHKAGALGENEQPGRAKARAEAQKRAKDPNKKAPKKRS